MGGDFMPENPVKGALKALALRDDIHIVLVGQQAAVDALDCGWSEHPRMSFVEAADVITMEDAPVDAYRKKKASSIHVGLQLLKDKAVDGFISAGNTGAVMTAATFILGRIKTVERPAIGTILPGNTGPVLMLDMGSTVDCKPTHLNQFAVMGHFFAQDVLDIPNPRVGLLNIGEEVEKGDQVTQEAHELLAANTTIRFVGNVEGKYVLNGHADVVVCDGFVGNNLLKFGEGIVQVFFDFFKQEIKGVRATLGALLMAPVLRKLKARYHQDNYGSAPLLGVNGVVFISHGSSSELAMCNGILNVAHAIETDMIDEITEAVGSA